MPHPGRPLTTERIRRASETASHAFRWRDALRSGNNRLRSREAGSASKDIPLFLFGALFIILAMVMYFFGEFVSIIRLTLGLGESVRSWNQAIVWYSGMPFTLGLCLAAADLVLLLPAKRRRLFSHILEPVLDRQVVVALTAYNDEASIADAVADFRSHPLVKKIIVVENNSSDKTAEIARAAGAIVVTETNPGYGRCVYRCFQEALAEQTQELIVLCEGDMTFRAKDLEKLVAYIDTPTW